MAESFSASRGYLEKSSFGPNCVGFTKTDVMTTSACARAVRTRERWPWCSAPIVGTKPTRLLAWRASLLMAVTSAAEVRMSMGKKAISNWAISFWLLAFSSWPLVIWDLAFRKVEAHSFCKEQRHTLGSEAYALI